MPAVALTAGAKLRLSCDSSVRRLASCRRLSARLMHAQSHCELHRAARISAQIDQAVAQLHATLIVLASETAGHRGAVRGPRLPATIAVAENKKAPEPHWLVVRAQSAAVSVAGFVARQASRPLVATAYVTASGAQHSAVATYLVLKPKVVCAVRYLITPSGFLNVGATACSFTSLQLATLATTCSAASVSANGLGAILQTSSEVIAATGDSGAIRRALRDPSYARELQELLNKRHQQKQRHRLLQTLSVWASLVNDGAVARVSPLASRVAARTGARVTRLITGEDDEAPRDDMDVHRMVKGKRSYLIESTRLALFVNTWVSTAMHEKVHAMRDTPEHSVQYLVGVAGQASEYHQLGWYAGSRAAYHDLISPAFSAAAGKGLTIGKQALGTAWRCATHPFATIYATVRPARMREAG